MKQALKVTSRTPVRIDLAGGTLDIWPLYLLVEQPTTVNMGIDLYAQIDLSAWDEAGPVTIVSEDQGAEVEADWDQILDPAFPHPSGLTLIIQAFRHYFTRGGKALLGKKTTLVANARSPAGAGLGGSSALNIALGGALTRWANLPLDVENIIETARDLESRILNGPAGLQDYYGAAYGGLQELSWTLPKPQRTALSKDVAEGLAKRIVLFFSGKSRNSGLNNWKLYKDFIDQKSQVREKFQKLSDCAHDLAQALKESDFPSAAKLIQLEWKTRKTLAKGISTREIDHAVKTATRAGAKAAKICGAGGGGCFFVLLEDEDPGLKETIVQKLREQGIRHLPYHSVPQGLEVHSH